MITTGINITNIQNWATTPPAATNEGGLRVEGNYIAVLNPSWNASTILVENAVSVMINVQKIIYLGGSTSGIGIEWFADNGEYIMGATIENLKMCQYFKIGLYLHTAGNGYINQNTVANSFIGTGADYCIKLYNNGLGIGVNHFIDVAIDSPNTSGGWGLWMGTGPSGTALCEQNSFYNLWMWDLTGTAKFYYQDDNYISTLFIGGSVGANYPSLISDSGIGTNYIATTNIQNGMLITDLSNIKSGTTGFISNGTWVLSGLDLPAGGAPIIILTPINNANGQYVTNFYVAATNQTAFQVMFDAGGYNVVFNYIAMYIPNNPLVR
jgi:hypothetical protein